MPSFQDSAVIFFLALLLFGPKKLPELARYVGKLMNEFRRASNEFRSQMEEEFRQAEQVEQQKKIADIEAAAPLAPIQNIPEPEHPHLDQVQPSDITTVGFPPLPGTPDLPPETRSDPVTDAGAMPTTPSHHSNPPVEPLPDPIPIATSGDLHLMPPATGLPVSRSSSSNSQPKPEPAKESNSLSGLFDSIPHAPGPEPAAPQPETTTHV